jgi:hypothetical protein
MLILRYDHTSREPIIRNDEEISLNLAYYISLDQEVRAIVAIFLRDVSSLLHNTPGPIDVTITPDRLSDDIRESLLQSHHISDAGYSIISDLIAAFSMRFSVKDPRIAVKRWTKPSCTSLERWENKLYVRYGNVELRAIDNALFRSNEVEAAIAQIKDRLNDDSFMYRAVEARHWLDFSDVSFNIRRLMTNAGFYFPPESPAQQFLFWADKYIHALAKADFWFAHDAYAYALKPQSHILQKFGRITPYICFPDRQNFYRTIAGRRILFLTPFADQINYLQKSGKLKNLYQDLIIDDFSVFSVKAEISTYPNRPHNSWEETFRALQAQIDVAFATEGVDFFLASAGCYGVPLCNYVYERYGCTSAYYGHYVNSLFGILSGPRQTPPLTPNLDNWLEGDLHEIKNFDKIDGGRYV